MQAKIQEKRKVRVLRRQGLSYKEILQQVSVAKSSVSAWCRDIKLTDEQKERLENKRLANLRKFRICGPIAMALKRQKEITKIKKEAKKDIFGFNSYGFKMIGVMLFWAEGGKTRGHGVEVANSDPELIKFIVKWAQEIFGIIPQQMKARLNIHIDQNDKDIKRYWSKITGIPLQGFGKSYIKPEGTGHRKNILQNGVIRIRLGGEDLRHRVMAWIEEIYSRQII